MHPANKRGFQAQIAQARQSIGHRPTRRLHPVFHRGIEDLAPLALDQLHDALFDAHHLKEGLIGLRNHIDNRIADAHNLILLHAVLSSNWQSSRMGQMPHLGLRATQI